MEENKNGEIKKGRKRKSAPGKRKEGYGENQSYIDGAFGADRKRLGANFVRFCLKTRKSCENGDFQKQKSLDNKKRGYKSEQVLRCFLNVSRETMAFCDILYNLFEFYCYEAP